MIERRRVYDVKLGNGDTMFRIVLESHQCPQIGPMSTMIKAEMLKGDWPRSGSSGERKPRISQRGHPQTNVDKTLIEELHHEAHEGETKLREGCPKNLRGGRLPSCAWQKRSGGPAFPNCRP